MVNILTRMVYRSVYCVLTLIPAELVLKVDCIFVEWLCQYTVNAPLWCVGAMHAAAARDYATRFWAGMDFR